MKVNKGIETKESWCKWSCRKELQSIVWNENGNRLRELKVVLTKNRN